MAIRVIVPGKRFERPTGPFRPNWDSPQAKGLLGWWTPGLTNTINHVTSLPATPSNVGRIGTRLGVGAEFIPGSSSYIDAGSLVNVGGIFSIAVIATSRLTGSTGNMIRYDAESDGSRDIIILRHESGQVRWYNMIGGGETSLYGASGLADNLPHTYLATHNVGAAVVYIDGAQSASTTGASGVGSTAAGSWFIGCDRGTSEFWDGAILDVRIYGRVLTAADARALHDPSTRWDLYWVPGRRVFFDVGAAAATSILRQMMQHSA